MNGLEVARHMALLPEPPVVVLTTAYDSYAVDAFDAQPWLPRFRVSVRAAGAPHRAARLAAQLAARRGRPADRPRPRGGPTGRQVKDRFRYRTSTISRDQK